MLFEESGIDPAVAAERGYFTARKGSGVPEVFSKYQRRPGLVVPMFSPDGETVGYQLRPDRPRKNGPKYETPGGSSPVVDVHPLMLEEVRSGARSLLITEGAKTGDAATSRGIPTLVLAGVWAWCVPKVKNPHRLRSCFDHVRLKGRKVYIIFDSDCMSKAGVQSALSALVEALTERGAIVKVVYLPDAPDGSKQGIDDYLTAGGTVREMFGMARDFDPAEVGEIRMDRDARLRATVEALERRWWDEEWKGLKGHSARDAALVLIGEAARHGGVHPDGIRVKASWGMLLVQSKISRRTLSKAIEYLEEIGFAYRDNEGRKPDKTGAFVLCAKVDQYGVKDGQGGEGLDTANPGGLPSRSPRLRWSRPKFTPKRGTVSGTRRVRQSPKLRPRDRIERLGKIVGAIVDALEISGGSMPIPELCEVLHYKRPRDLLRRKTTAKGRNGPAVVLLEAGIVEVDGDVLRLAADWETRLEGVRRLAGEIEADELDERRRKLRSRAYRDRNKPLEAKPSAAGIEAVRRSLEKAAKHWRENLVGWVEKTPPATLSPLAVAVRDYLDKHPADARQPAGWIGVTLWTYGLHPKLNNPPADIRTAIEELGGATYLDTKFKEAKRAA